MNEIKEIIKGAVMQNEMVWVEVLLPATWPEYRLRKEVPDLVLMDPETCEKWFPIFAADQRYAGHVYLPASWGAVLAYTADQTAIEGVVINPYTDNPCRLSCEIIKEILDEIKD